MANKDNQKIIAILESIMSRYNSQFDIIPDGPPVTYIELKLAEMIGILSNQIIDLQNEVNKLKEK